MDRIELTALRVETIVGILDAEQRAPQPIDVEIALELPLEPAARTGELDRSIDYAAVQAWFCTLTQQGRWRLIESLAMATCRLLLAPPGPGEERAAIGAVEVAIRKPTILVGAVPGVRVRREAAWCDLGQRQVQAGVRIGTLEATPVQGAWRIALEPGARWAVPPTWSLHVLGGEGQIGRAGVGYGEVVARAPGVVVQAGDRGITLLGVGAPA
jgi:7,8-dihydroneopterin aldolase/epimerase/oxygenase